ncbi:hypothetical protein B0A48_08817, partial [Cryoendolithus antarcticus]
MASRIAKSAIGAARARPSLLTRTAAPALSTAFTTSSARREAAPQVPQVPQKDPKDAAKSILDSLPGSSLPSKVGILSAGAGLSVAAISNEIYVVNEESIIFLSMLTIYWGVYTYLGPMYKDFSDGYASKIKNILNSAREDHTNAVKSRINNVKDLGGVIDITKDLFAVSKARLRETAQLEAQAYEAEQKTALAAEMKTVLDSWVRYEGQVKQRQQKELAESIIAKITKELENPKTLDQILKQSVADVERILSPDLSDNMASAHKFAKGKLINNPAYKANGLKSYARAAIRYNIKPTIDGPLCAINKVAHQGKFGPGKAVGGRTTMHGHVLAKKDPTSGQTGEVPATDVEENALYLVPVAIGTPAQTLNLDFDTGSSDLWVWSTELPATTTKNAKGHTIFNPTKSSTFEKTASTWKISYGDGSSASGDVGTDTVNIGGLIIKQQAVELAKTLSSSFASGQGDGLLGLAFGSINTVTPKPVATPVENMIAQDDIKPGEELFTAFLSQPTADSFYTFGFIDQDSLGGQTPAYAPVDNSQGFWMFDSASANLNGETIARSGNKAIADTGTTLCLIDDETLAKIYGTIPGAKIDSSQQGWVFPKSTPADTLPSVGFAVGDTVFYVQKADLAFQDLNDGSGNVFGGIQSRGSGQDFDILG